MQFCYWLANHGLMGQRSLEDVIGIMGAQLRALGHHAVWMPDNKNFVDGASGINVIVEGFTPPIIEVIAEYHAKGARFLCLATEEPTPAGFNHGRIPEMRMRQEHFGDAMKYFEGILYLVPGQSIQNWYSQFKPAAFMDLGFAPSLVRPVLNVAPKYDFGFYGSISEYRMKMLKKLRHKTHRTLKVVGDFLPQAERDREMAECKVILEIKKFPEMELVSNSRCNTALSIGRPVWAEGRKNPGVWDRIVGFARSEAEFISAAPKFADDWMAIHAMQFARFKGMLTPEATVGDPLRQIGILPALERAAA